ncbi:MAG TPA: adenylate/guanylate cyclase domain-containing protein [Roseiarcus sp.]|nr:adenylate/guanylate cyclase domain-containing protein [Roseiarcus sp.]
MKGLTDFEVLSSPFFYSGERPQRLSVESASRLRKSSRRAARPRLERKLAAIVAADVVGYSRLTGRDEEGAARRLCETQAAISPIVEAAGGRTVNIAGDAMLLEFSSTVAALDCALAIQDLVGLSNRGVPDDDKMLLRIGINVGDVIVRGGDVFGEVVNVASRLEAIAEPGGICVSHACYIQTKRQFAMNFADLGEQRLKNIAEPVRAYAVRPPRASSLQEAVPSQSAAPAASAPPFAEAQAFGGEPTRAETELAEPSGNSRRLTEAPTASVAKNHDAFADCGIVESAPRHQVESPNVLQWPGRRRREG